MRELLEFLCSSLSSVRQHVVLEKSFMFSSKLKDMLWFLSACGDPI